MNEIIVAIKYYNEKRELIIKDFRKKNNYSSSRIISDAKELEIIEYKIQALELALLN